MDGGQFVTDHCHLNMAHWQLKEEQESKAKQNRHVFNLGRRSPLYSLPVKNTREEKVGPFGCSAQHPCNSLAHTKGPSPGTQKWAIFIHMLKKKKIKKGQE